MKSFEEKYLEFKNIIKKQDSDVVDFNEFLNRGFTLEEIESFYDKLFCEKYYAVKKEQSGEFSRQKVRKLGSIE